MSTTPSASRSNGDILDGLGRAIIGADYRVVSLIVIAVLVALALARWRARRGFPQAIDFIRASVGLAGVWSGVMVSSAFLLTKPPYLDPLSGMELGLIGLASLVVFCGLGLREVFALFLPPTPPNAGGAGLGPPAS